MPYRLVSNKRVDNQLDALPEPVFRRINQALQDLCNNPRPSGVKKMQGTATTYRVRVGGYRIVYGVDDTAQEIRLLRIGDRKDVYRP